MRLWGLNIGGYDTSRATRLQRKQATAVRRPPSPSQPPSAERPAIQRTERSAQPTLARRR